MEQKADAKKQQLRREPSKEMLNSLDLLEKFELVKMMKELKIMKNRSQEGLKAKEEK